MIRALLIAGVALASLGPAFGQEDCPRPVAPDGIEPPEDDPEFRAFLNQDYQTYLVDMETLT